MSGVFELRAGAARLVIAPEVGGSIAHYEHDGTPVLRPTSAHALAAGSVREFACYPLLPFSNRIAGATLHWDGGSFALRRYMDTDPNAIHGNAWQRAWQVVERDERGALLELVHTPASGRSEEWPFAYRAQQRFMLDAEGVSLHLQMRNDAERAAPAGLGWHPFFPRPPGTELEFRAQGVWYTDRTLLPIEHSIVPPEWDFAQRRALGDVAIDNCFTGWRSPARVHWPARGAAAEIRASIECEDLVVYVPPGRDFLAIEPVTHMTDAFNRSSRGIAGTGTRTLAPGESFSCTMRLSLQHNHR